VTGRRAAAKGRAGEPEVDPALARRVSAKLRRWFRRHGRDLPWRRTRDPYRVLVSELMLQQTQVARVVDYYARFLERFPTLGHVAESPVEHVADAWAGLGYYARARNLHALARHVTRDGGPGAIPAAPDQLRALPGVGAYTAGAVASFAYERRAALVDTNVARVLARVFAPELNPKRPRDLSRIWRIAERVLPRTGAAAWAHNQALMELGATVCTARVRRCAACPARRECATHASRGCPGGLPTARRAGGPPAPRVVRPPDAPPSPPGRRRAEAGTPSPAGTGPAGPRASPGSTPAPAPRGAGQRTAPAS